MIAMQYGFTLPADYDMTVIDRRIAEKGHLLDGFPHLAFKAYLSARGEPGNPASPANVYAPFYLWHEPEGIDAFLGSAGFAALTQSFGWPAISLWPVWHASRSEHLDRARFATRRIEAIPAYADLGSLRSAECKTARDSVDELGALAAVSAFEPSTWTLVRFTLWDKAPEPEQTAGAQVYGVGYVAVGA